MSNLLDLVGNVVAIYDTFALFATYVSTSVFVYVVAWLAFVHAAVSTGVIVYVVE
jgi:hypothetical protein